MLSFYKALLKNPRSIGAIIPSSSFLANAIAKKVALKDDQIVVELGAGTGVITQGLLDFGIPSNRIVLIEASSTMVKTLNRRFPEVNTIHGNALDLSKLIKPLNKQVGAVICGLPFLLFPPQEIQLILNQVAEVLAPGGRYIKFTYGFKDAWDEVLNHYQKIKKTYIFLNIPPARVCVYEAPQD